MKTNRGMLTPEIKNLSLKLLGHEITVREFRLMPYIQFLMVNDQCIERDKINDEERGILERWKSKGYISSSLGDTTISKEFWDAINQIIYVGYVE